MQKYLWASREERSLGPEHVGMIQLALPIVCENILRVTVSFVDVAFLSKLSDGVVSAVSVASQYILVCIIIAMSLASGSVVCINQAIGMKNLKRVDRMSTIAVTANMVLGLLFGLLFLSGSDVILIIMKLEPESREAAKLYMNIVGGCMVFQCVEIILTSLCRSMGRTNTPLIINLLENIVNVVGNYISVVHGAVLGIDPLTGVAVSTVISRIVGMLIAMTVVLRTGIHFSLKLLKPLPVEDIKLSLSIGIPGGFNNIAYSVSQIATTAIISLTGETMLAAKVYVCNVVNYVALVGMGFGSAGSIMIGYLIGADKFDDVEKIHRLVTRIGLVSNVFFSLLVIFIRYPMLSIFTSDATILRIGGALFFIDFVVEIGRSLNNTIAGALTAAGDVQYQLVVNQLSGWLISVLGSYIFGILLGWGLYGVWIAFALDEMTRGLLLLFRWRSGKWITGARARRKVIAQG